MQGPGEASRAGRKVRIGITVNRRIGKPGDDLGSAEQLLLPVEKSR
jgi:hypothetical protein